MTPATDKFGAMVCVLCGRPAPPLPAIRGHVHRAPPSTDQDEYAISYDAINSRIPTDPKGIP